MQSTHTNQFSGKVKSFTDLNTWREAHKLVLEIYLITKNFRKDELFVLTSQIRRAVISITSNIAEGFSRRGKKEKLQFYYIAKGSLTEVQNQLVLARDLQYISTDTFNEIAKQSTLVSRLISGLIKSAMDSK